MDLCPVVLEPLDLAILMRLEEATPALELDEDDPPVLHEETIRAALPPDVFKLSAEPPRLFRSQARLPFDV